MLDCVRRDYPSRRDARIAEDDLGDFYEVRQVYINRLELEGWDDNGQEVPLSPWDVQRVREAICEHQGQKPYPTLSWLVSSLSLPSPSLLCSPLSTYR